MPLKVSATVLFFGRAHLTYALELVDAVRQQVQPPGHVGDEPRIVNGEKTRVGMRLDTLGRHSLDLLGDKAGVKKPTLSPKMSCGEQAA